MWSQISLFSAEFKPRSYYLEHFWQADLGYIGQAIIGVKAPNSSHVACIQHGRVQNYTLHTKINGTRLTKIVGLDGIRWSRQIVNKGMHKQLSNQQRLYPSSYAMSLILSIAHPHRPRIHTKLDNYSCWFTQPGHCTRLGTFFGL